MALAGDLVVAGGISADGEHIAGFGDGEAEPWMPVQRVEHGTVGDPAAFVEGGQSVHHSGRSAGDQRREGQRSPNQRDRHRIGSRCLTAGVRQQCGHHVPDHGRVHRDHPRQPGGWLGALEP